MNKLFFTLLSATALALLGCSESSHTNNSDINDGEGEYAEGEESEGEYTEGEGEN